MLRKNLLIVGAGGFGREVFQWIFDHPHHFPEIVIKGFVDNFPSSGIQLPVPLLGNDEWAVKQNLGLANEKLSYTLALGSAKLREKVGMIYENSMLNPTKICYSQSYMIVSSKIM